MKLLTAVLAIALVIPVWASRSITMKGKLESYTDTHFKLRQGKKIWKFPLSSMDGVDQVDIARKVGKEITVNVPIELVKQGK
jgi:hypothetical protein